MNKSDFNLIVDGCLPVLSQHLIARMEIRESAQTHISPPAHT